MKFEEKRPPRAFEVGLEPAEMLDCGTLELAPNEQVTLTTESGGEYDVARKEWGFYATPSLNSRLEAFGLRGVLAKNRDGRYFVLLVERGREEEFERYLEEESMEVVCWLDSGEALEELERRLR